MENVKTMFVQIQMKQLVIIFHVPFQILLDVVIHIHYQIVQHLQIKQHVIKSMEMVIYVIIMIKIYAKNFPYYHNVQIIQMFQHFAEFFVIIMKQLRLVQIDNVIFLLHRIHV